MAWKVKTVNTHHTLPPFSRRFKFRWKAYYVIHVPLNMLFYPDKMEDLIMRIHCISVCSFVWGLSSRSRIFHSYGDITIADEGLQILTYAWHSWRHWAVRVLQRATPTVTRGICLWWSSPRTRDSHSYCWASIVSTLHSKNNVQLIQIHVYELD